MDPKPDSLEGLISFMYICTFQPIETKFKRFLVGLKTITDFLFELCNISIIKNLNSY